MAKPCGCIYIQYGQHVNLLSLCSTVYTSLLGYVFHKIYRGLWFSISFTAQGFGIWFCWLFIRKTISPWSTLLLQAEKNELRDEKQRLKAEKESLEQQIKFLNARPSLVPHHPVIPASAFAAPQGPAAAGHKLIWWCLCLATLDSRCGSLCRLLMLTPLTTPSLALLWRKQAKSWWKEAMLPSIDSNLDRYAVLLV